MLLFPQYIARMTYQNTYGDIMQLSTLYDRNSDIFCQLLLLLHHHPTFVEMLTASVPRPESLFTDYHLPLAVAASILRSVLHSSEVILQLVHSPLASLGDSNPWDITTPAFEKTVKSFYPPTTWSTLSFNGFLAFWLLQYSDLSLSKECYEEYVSVIEKEMKEKEKEKSSSRSERSAARQIEELKKEMKEVKEDENRVRNHVLAMEVRFIVGCSYLAYSEGTLCRVFLRARRQCVCCGFHSVLLAAARRHFTDGRTILCGIRARVVAMGSEELQSHSVREARSDGVFVAVAWRHGERGAECEHLSAGGVHGPVSLEREPEGVRAGVCEEFLLCQGMGEA